MNEKIFNLDIENWKRWTTVSGSMFDEGGHKYGCLVECPKCRWKMDIDHANTLTNHDESCEYVKNFNKGKIMNETKSIWLTRDINKNDKTGIAVWDHQPNWNSSNGSYNRQTLQSTPTILENPQHSQTDEILSMIGLSQIEPGAMVSLQVTISSRNINGITAETLLNDLKTGKIDRQELIEFIQDAQKYEDELEW